MYIGHEMHIYKLFWSQGRMPLGLNRREGCPSNACVHACMCVCAE